MRSIVVREFGEPEVMRIEEVETPLPDGTQVLVRIHAAGVNPVDTYLRTGIHAHAPKLPYTPGKDGAGVVEAVGTAVTKWKAGDRVYTANSVTGTYAEYCLCEEIDLGRLPENVSFEKGAGIWTPYATAYRALFQKAGAQQGETVLIHGASGGVGLAAVQWLTGPQAPRLPDSTGTAANRPVAVQSMVIGTASSEDGRKLILDNGADAVFDHTEAAHFEQINELTEGRGVDIIIEMLANVNLERDFDCLAIRGRIVVVGNRGSLQFTPRLAMTKDATIYGMSLFNSSQAERDEIHHAIYRGLESGELDPHVRGAYELSEADRSHHDVIENKALGKIILVP
jgi:NADPH2:quinone reductase